MFLKASLEESVQQIFLVIQNLPQPLTPTQVNHIIMTALSSSITRARIQSIEQVLLKKVPPLNRLYSALSGGSQQQPATAL